MLLDHSIKDWSVKNNLMLIILNWIFFILPLGFIDNLISVSISFYTHAAFEGE